MSFRLGNFIPRVTAHSERDLFAWSLLAAVILFSLLAMPFFGSGLYRADDLGNFHLSARAFYAEQLAHGESFDWMPGVRVPGRAPCTPGRGGGCYLTGEGQVGTYHPLHRFLYRFLPFRAALCWEYLCSYPLMLAGMYFLLRRRLRRQDAAMVGSLAFTFSSFNLLHFVHPNAVAAVAHIPWLLAMIDIVMVDAKRWKVALAQAFLALLTGSQILLGCLQYVCFSLLTEAGFTLFLAMTRRYFPRDGCETMPTCRVCIGCQRNSSSRVIVAKGIGLLVGAIQFLPALETLFQSARPGVPGALGGRVPSGCEGATLHPINLIQLVAPYLPIDRAFGGNAHELSLYVGAVPLMLALWVLVRHGDLGGMKRLAQATAALAVAGLLLALGGALGGYPLVGAGQGRFPSLQNSVGHPVLWVGAAWFQFSCRYTVLFQFAMAVLAAIGFVLVERESRERHTVQRHLPILSARSRAAELWRQFEILGATVLVSLAVAVAGLILQTGHHHVASIPRVLVGPLLMAAAALLVIAAARGVRGALVGLVLFLAADLGYYGLSCTLDAIPTQLIGCPGAGAPGGAPSTLGRGRDGLLAQETLQVPDPLPLVRLVTHVVPSQDPAERAPGRAPWTHGRGRAKIDVGHHVLMVDEALCEYALALPPGKPGTATLTRHRAGQMLVKVCCSSPQLLVIAESYHPGWRCSIDGSPKCVYRVNGDSLGCVVEPGNSEVCLEFHPDSLAHGRLVTLAGLGLIGLCLFTGASRWQLKLVEKIGLNRA